MLQQPLYSLFIRLIPEAFFILLSVCLLTNSKINYKNIAIASIIGGTCVYIFRMMPVHFGIHTIIGVMVYILLSYKYSNIQIHKAVVGALITVILLFISDTMLFFLYKGVLNLPLDILVGNSLLAVIATLPSLIIFYIIVILIVNIKGIKVKNG